MYRVKGMITVFFSLLAVLFLSLFCTLIESARVQGARAQAAAAVDMGLFSVFGEYDKELLESYDVLFVDASYGTGKFKEENLAVRMQDFMYPNLHPEEAKAFGRAFSLFPVELDTCDVENFALATDDGGKVFYTQAVENEKKLLISEELEEMTSQAEEAKKQNEAGEQYEKEAASSENALSEAYAAKRKQEAEEAEAQAGIEGSEGEGEVTEVAETPETEPVENPLDEIKKIQKMGILALVMKHPERISNAAVSSSKLPSGRSLNKGNLEVKTESGIGSNILFTKYLLHHFENASDLKEKQQELSCELEYIFAGKSSDMENMKVVVNRLLLMREGVNYVCAFGNAAMQEETLTLATAIAAGAPVLIPALQQALILAWCYGESLLDVRTLLAGGKVPAVKSAADWKLSLSNLGKLLQVLESCDSGGGEGMDYEDYLMVLLTAGKKNSYPLRALDMIELRMKVKKGESNFRADCLAAQMKVNCSCQLKPVFLSVPHAFMGISNEGISMSLKGEYGYMGGV